MVFDGCPGDYFLDSGCKMVSNGCPGDYFLDSGCEMVSDGCPGVQLPASRGGNRQGQVDRKGGPVPGQHLPLHLERRHWLPEHDLKGGHSLNRKSQLAVDLFMAHAVRKKMTKIFSDV